MSITDLETYEGQCARLDTDYIVRAGAEIAAELEAGHVVGVAYAPDNGTSYQLIFVPVETIEQVGTRLAHDTWRVPTSGFYGDPLPGRVLVVKANGTESDFSYVFDLRPGVRAHASYVGEHARMNLADASALTALFRAICGTEILP